MSKQSIGNHQGLGDAHGVCPLHSKVLCDLITELSEPRAERRQRDTEVRERKNETPNIHNTFIQMHRAETMTSRGHSKGEKEAGGHWQLERKVAALTFF